MYSVISSVNPPPPPHHIMDALNKITDTEHDGEFFFIELNTDFLKEDKTHDEEKLEMIQIEHYICPVINNMHIMDHIVSKHTDLLLSHKDKHTS